MADDWRRAAVLAAVTVALGGMLAGQAQDLPFRVNRVTDRVTVFTPGRFAPPSASTVIATPSGLLVVDAGLSPRLAEMTRRRMKQELGRDDVAWVINTHHHFDHTNGNQVYRGAEIIAHEKVPAAMRQFQADVARFVATRTSRLAQQERDLKAAEPGSDRARSLEETVIINRMLVEDLQGRWVATPPTRTFTDSLALKAGDLDVRLWHVGRAHTETDIIVQVPSLGVVFVGDLFMASALGVIPEPGSVPAVARWVEVFERVVGKPDEMRTVVGGHGDIMNGAWLALQHRYMKDLWSEVAAAAAKGRTLSEVEPELDLKTRFAYVLETFGEQNARHRENIASYWRAATAGAALTAPVPPRPSRTAAPSRSAPTV